MATITGLTAERMIEMENATVVDGDIVGNDLVLKTRDNTQINAGNVRGPIGPAGASFITCTSTTRPTLSAGEEGKAIWETDTDLVRYWTGTRWRLQEYVVCTSTTRPAGLVAVDEGVMIYETNTNLNYTWSGSAWVLTGTPIFVDAAARNTIIPSPVSGMSSFLNATGAFEFYTNLTAPAAWKPPFNMPWGQLSYKTLSSSQSIGQGVYSGVLFATIILTAPRRLRFGGNATIYKGGSDSPGVGVLLIQQTTSGGANVAFLSQRNQTMGTNTQIALSIDVRGDYPAGTYYFALTAYSQVSFMNVEAGALFYIDDIGPTGQPS